MADAPPNVETPKRRNTETPKQGRLIVHAEVQEALHASRPVVALESAVITCGLPRATLTPDHPAELPGWDDAAPANLECARSMARAVRAAGAVPAVVAIIDGSLHVGLDDEVLVRLAEDADAGKTAAGDLAATMTCGATAGTTVSATLVACGLTGVETFATGGLGGVHRGWCGHPDVSADLGQLARTRCCVVCSGPKVVLDVPATLEALETLGVPVLGFRTDAMPRFYAEADASLRVTRRVEDAAGVAAVCRTRWSVLGQGGSVVVAQPLPVGRSLPGEPLERRLETAMSEAAAAGIRGAALTPFLLETLAETTGGRTLQANITLLAANAALAAAIATTLG